MNKKTIILTIVIVVLVALIAFLVYINYFYTKDCSSLECFKTHLTTCSRATYQSDKEDATWKYSITGQTGSLCDVNVLLLQAKQGDLGLNDLNGQEMTCSIERGLVAYPENDLSKCHGLLKESLQDLLIKKLYGYIADNIGQIGSDLKKVV